MLLKRTVSPQCWLPMNTCCILLPSKHHQGKILALSLPCAWLSVGISYKNEQCAAQSEPGANTVCWLLVDCGRGEIGKLGGVDAYGTPYACLPLLRRSTHQKTMNWLCQGGPGILGNSLEQSYRVHLLFRRYLS